MNEEIIYPLSREEWRLWLEGNFAVAGGIWVAYPLKSSGLNGIEYNDAVEEALCFGWIDSIAKGLDSTHRIQRFTPRRKGSRYSQTNIERLRKMSLRSMIHASMASAVSEILGEEYKFPEDILRELKSDPAAWDNFCAFPEPYRRIRVAYIDDARMYPEEFMRRLENLKKKNRENKLIKSTGGADIFFE